MSSSSWQPTLQGQSTAQAPWASVPEEDDDDTSPLFMEIEADESEEETHGSAKVGQSAAAKRLNLCRL